MIKRLLLFLLTNLMVIMTLSLVTTALGLHDYLSAKGLDYHALAVFCALWGSGGAFISLILSKWFAKIAMGVRLIDPQSADPSQKALLDVVYRLAKKAGLTKMPEVGIYQSSEVNAFATGPSRQNALVAVSSGLLNSMNSAEVEGVLGHEISHIANGDMVTMMLIQGVVNAFALFLSRVIAYAISMSMSRNENNHAGPAAIYFVLVMVFDVLFTLLASLVVAAFSRYREYRADSGGALLAGKINMIAALQRLQKISEVEDQRAPSLAVLKISHQQRRLSLFSSHPPLELRIARLR